MLSVQHHSFHTGSQMLWNLISAHIITDSNYSNEMRDREKEQWNKKNVGKLWFIQMETKSQYENHSELKKNCCQQQRQQQQLQKSTKIALQETKDKKK